MVWRGILAPNNLLVAGKAASKLNFFIHRIKKTGPQSIFVIKKEKFVSPKILCLDTQYSHCLSYLHLTSCEVELGTKFVKR